MNLLILLPNPKLINPLLLNLLYPLTLTRLQFPHNLIMLTLLIPFPGRHNTLPILITFEYKMRLSLPRWYQILWINNDRILLHLKI